MAQKRSLFGSVLVCVVVLFTLFVHQRVMAEGSVEALKKQLLEMQQNMNKLMTRIEQLEQKKTDTNRVTRVEESAEAVKVAGLRPFLEV